VNLSATAANIEALRDLVESKLSGLVTESEPKDLYDPVKYVLAGGGKRLRPILLLLTARAFDTGVEDALHAALAVEVFHNFSLVHDDIMDHSDERRGRPTVHVKWSEEVAVLTGDYLLALSYRILSESRRDVLPQCLEVFHEMVADLCEGQTLDKAFETRRDVSIDEYFAMVDAKTGALLRACLELGGVLGGASPKERQALRDAGTTVGRAFQIQDDLLDVVAEDQRWGKKVGGDLIEGKRTYVLLRCLEALEGEEREWFQRIIDQSGLEPERVDEARERMSRAGVLADARTEIERLTGSATGSLRILADRSLGDVAALVESMMTRRH
jgi:geranylgeranyl diphosphate synthase type II